MSESRADGFAAGFARTYVETAMTLDVERVVALFAEDAVLHHPSATVTGRAELRAFYREFLAPMAEIDLRPERVLGDERAVAFEWAGRTRYGDGRIVRVSGCDVVTLAGGLIVQSKVHIHRIEEARDA